MKKIMLLLLVCSSFVCFSQNSQLSDPEPYFSALIVSDMDASLAWYTSVLGLEVISQKGSEEAGFKITNLKRGALFIELIELSSSVSPKEAIPEFTDKTRLQGIFKTGYLLPDFELWVARLEKLGVNFQGKVVTDPLTDKKMIIIKDPDGNRIQLFEK